MQEDVDDIKVVFWKIMLADFPGCEDASRPLERLCIRVFENGDQRSFESACMQFLEDAGRHWPRYDAYLAYWNCADPRIPEIEDGEIVADGDFREAGELLAHRIVMAYYQQRQRCQFSAEADAFPYWRLRVIKDGRTPPECVAEAAVAHDWRDRYWREKQLPCARLFCRCSIIRQENP